MKRTLTDFSQLSKALLKAAPQADEVKPAPPKTKAQGDEVLAYFSHSAPNGAAAPAQDAEALRARLRDAEAARSEIGTRLAEKDRECGKLTDALAAARKEIDRLKGECGRLQGELRKATAAASAASREPTAPLVAQPVAKSVRGVLVPPADLREAFPGELREMVLAALSDARDMARQGTRERRAAVLDAVLAVNRSTGELTRRRDQLKQMMKDAGYYTNPYALESLGIKLISGKTHWKLEYAGVRMPIAKTPSDYRANLNMAIDMSNRCF